MIYPAHHYGTDMRTVDWSLLQLPGCGKRGEPAALSEPEGPVTFDLVSRAQDRIPAIASIVQDSTRVVLEIQAGDAEAANSMAWALALTLIDDYDMMHDGDLED